MIMGGSILKTQSVQEDKSDLLAVTQAMPLAISPTNAESKVADGDVSSKYCKAREAPRLPRRTEPQFRLPVRQRCGSNICFYYVVQIATAEIDELIKQVLHDLAQFQVILLLTLNVVSHIWAGKSTRTKRCESKEEDCSGFTRS
jgi:hypothetical protein